MTTAQAARVSQAAGIPSRLRVLPAMERADTPLYRDPFRLTMLVLLVETTSKVSGYFGPLIALRPALVLFVGCLIFACVNPAKAFNHRIFQFWIPRLVVCQAILACASALFGISLGHS